MTSPAPAHDSMGDLMGAPPLEAVPAARQLVLLPSPTSPPGLFARMLSRLFRLDALHALWVAALTVAAALLLLLARAEWTPAAIALALATPILVGVATFVVAARRQVRLSRELRLLHDDNETLHAELAGVAHDLRSPLVTVQSYLELLSEESFGRLPLEAKQAAQRGLRAVEQARTIADQSLRLGLGDAADEEMDDEDDLAAAECTPVVGMNELLESVRLGLETELKESRAVLEVQELPDVEGDRDALYRVFSNLVENGVKYAASGRRPRILVTGHLEGDMARFEVRDWGVGIPLGEHDRVFALRYRGPDTDAPGSGLGLSIVQRLVNAQGGRVWIDPMTAGTSVRVLLPAA